MIRTVRAIRFWPLRYCTLRLLKPYPSTRVAKAPSLSELSPRAIRMPWALEKVLRALGIVPRELSARVPISDQHYCESIESFGKRTEVFAESLCKGPPLPPPPPPPTLNSKSNADRLVFSRTGRASTVSLAQKNNHGDAAIHLSKSPPQSLA